MEYKRIVELISQKYIILKDQLAEQKSQLEKQQYDEMEKALEEQYKDDVISIAVAIDDTLEKK